MKRSVLPKRKVNNRSINFLIFFLYLEYLAAEVTEEAKQTASAVAADAQEKGKRINNFFFVFVIFAV